MKEDLNRILFALIAQVANEDAQASSGTSTNEAGEEARREALQSLLFDPHSSATSQLFSVPATVRDVLDECARILPERIKTSVELYDGKEQALGDPHALRGLATLLAAQALHAIGDGPGRLFARVERVDEAEVGIECPELGPGSYVRVVVEAFTGEEERDRNVLDPLFRVPRGAGESWNLGLALARKAAWSLGGVIGQTSDRSLCTAYLPLIGRLRPRSRPSLVGHPGSRLGLGILYVSCEEAILVMGKSSLIQSDCCVKVACSGRDALHCLETRADEIDVVVVEDDLEDMSGNALVDELRGRIADLPVLMVTRVEKPVELREYIMKPFSAGDLRAAVWKATVPCAGR